MDYKPEVPSHNYFKSQLCGTLKNLRTIPKRLGSQSSQCCGLAFTQVKNIRVCKMMESGSSLFENQGHCRVLGFVFYFFIQEEHLLFSRFDTFVK